MALMLAVGEAQGVLFRASQAGDDSSWHNFIQAAGTARDSLRQAIEALATEPVAPAPQTEFHSGPG